MMKCTRNIKLCDYNEFNNSCSYDGNCEFKHQLTNYEKIKEMSVNELAEFITNEIQNAIGFYALSSTHTWFDKQNDINIHLDWLVQKCE